jgi:hypothetical protein
MKSGRRPLLEGLRRWPPHRDQASLHPPCRVTVKIHGDISSIATGAKTRYSRRIGLVHGRGPLDARIERAEHRPLVKRRSAALLLPRPILRETHANGVSTVHGSYETAAKPSRPPCQVPSSPHEPFR